jgi:hypothetical protein
VQNKKEKYIIWLMNVSTSACTDNKFQRPQVGTIFLRKQESNKQEIAIMIFATSQVSVFNW